LITPTLGSEFVAMYTPPLLTLPIWINNTTASTTEKASTTPKPAKSLALTERSLKKRIASVVDAAPRRLIAPARS
jgi:hypothetical protein